MKEASPPEGPHTILFTFNEMSRIGNLQICSLGLEDGKKTGNGGWGEPEADKRGSDRGLDLNGGSSVRSI